MNAIEIRNLSKSFRGMYALNGLNMTVPMGAIYGFIGENGSGKSTTEKIICGLTHPSGGSVKLFGRAHTDTNVRAKVGVLFESPGCYPNMSVWNNLKLQAANLSLETPDEEIRKILKLVRMEGAAGNKYKNCSLGMKQRIGIAMALLGNPTLLVLDEPINGLDADGMRIMREILVDVTKNGATVLVSSHILGELEKVATHYGIVRGGKMIAEMTAEELEASCRTFVALQTKDMGRTKALLDAKYPRVEEDENGSLRVYGAEKPEYVISKTVVGFVGAAAMFIAFFIGALLGGDVASLPFDMVGFDMGNIVACMLSKIFLGLVFVAVCVLASVISKQKTWLSIILSFGIGMLFFTMIPMVTPLDSTSVNVVLCFIVGTLFGVGIGAISNTILKKTSIL